MDRQKVSNLRAIAKLGERQQAGVQQQIDVIEQEAMAMTDPKQGEAWFKLRSQQMIDLAKLNDQIQAATTTKERDRLVAEYGLINAANNADIKQFYAKQQAQTSPMMALAEQLGEVIAAINSGNPNSN